ncbi:MAG TPA: hypothetical protein VHO25_08950 [Polyangiaceae bacterium]|nr:hypothetical protein [Polyangiaceae bacterium]
MRHDNHSISHPHSSIVASLAWLCFATLLAGLGCSSGDGGVPAPTVTNTPGSSSSEFQLLDEYEPAAGQPGSSAIAADDERFVAWATGYAGTITLGSDVEEGWDDPDHALAVAEGETESVLSLGNGGVVTLTFADPIGNGEGADFAVFENGFDDFFLELAFVEVSSNGEDFQRFDCAYLGDEPIGQYDTHDTELIGGLAGKYRAGFGTPFDLELLQDKDLVADGDLDLDAITHVRIVDIIGDGSAEDSFGHPIYDPTPTVGSGGFDLDGIGVIHVGD